MNECFQMKLRILIPYFLQNMLQTILAAEQRLHTMEVGLSTALGTLHAVMASACIVIYKQL